MGATSHGLLAGTGTHAEVSRRSVGQTYRVTQANETCISTARDTADMADTDSLLETQT